MSYVIELTKTALEDIERHKKSGDLKVLKKIDELLNELLEHPHSGTGQPEILKNQTEETYSRRINRRHRLIYRINEEKITVLVLSAYSHYGDK